jgi:hypothetical protein
MLEELLRRLRQDKKFWEDAIRNGSTVKNVQFRKIKDDNISN